ncbi:MAG: ThuA domain-containing protein [Saprospiraceae bacterium]|nr:ThuA domain-containing protein [Saprospiraceae bacterium]
MKRTFPMMFLTLLGLVLLFSNCNKRSEAPRILIFSKTAGFHHASIPAGIEAIKKLAAENNFVVDTTTDAAWFHDDTLRRYAAVVFLNTTGDVLDHFQEANFERYIQAGGGFVGIHSATDTEYQWGWYGRMVGGYFNGHPPGTAQATLNVTDAGHISTKHLPNPWKHTDEWYNFKNLNPDVNVLLKIDEKSYTGGTNGDNHPMAWYHEYDGGRAWYTALGHTDESYSEPEFIKHLLGGIQYAIGKNKKLNYAKALTHRAPEEDRFSKTALIQGTFFEPTEMTILPNFDILIGQRRGEVLLYKNGSDTVKQALFLNVYHKTNTRGVNAEEGLLGIQKDPDFARNHFVYIFYSPIDTSVNRLSRFKFENDTLTSEKVILQFYSQREICCHTGGSIAFGKDRIMFLSTGDNSTPFDEPDNPYANHGFGPLDDRLGKEQYDARRSSSNTNDLRGKILRIRINEDGTYDIPEGNLFPKGTEKARPEIYVMGNRNPYRISVDQKNGFLYWGEVGPDANVDSMDTRGPRGYDEVNQAREAGYFGWPLFIGDNYAYREHNYATGENGVAFDAQKPINNSRNNTGLRELPPSSPAFIWYPYAESPEFPQTGTGGRNAMAGPVYYTDLFPEETRLPEYYNGKLIIYDWIRGWIKAVTMRPNGDFDKMEPFMPNTKFINPIDMEVGPDGRLYVLEYGSGWFSKNPDAGLYRLDFNGGNLPPKVESIAVNKTSGLLPLKVRLDVEVSDPEGDPLTYVWHINNEREIKTTTPYLEETFKEAGDYNIVVEVHDDKGASMKSNLVNVYAGNEAPLVDIAIAGNQMFYFPGRQVAYNVSVKDPDNPAAQDLNDLVVVADYIEGTDKAAMAQGHQILNEAAMGKNLMASLDCKACHREAEKSIGPAYIDVAKRYKNDPNVVTYLTQKIIRGGGGVWGETAMAAHPGISETDARQIIAWIQSLANTEAKVKSLAAKGSISPTAGKPIKDNGVLYLSATFTDKGDVGVKPLSSSKTVALRNSKLSFAGMETTDLQGYTTAAFGGMNFLIVPATDGWFKIDSLDLTDIQKLTLGMGWREAPVPAYSFEVRLDKPDGEKIGELAFAGSNTPPANRQHTISGAINAITDGKIHDLYIVSKVGSGDTKNTVVLTFLQFLAGSGGLLTSNAGG